MSNQRAQNQRMMGVWLHSGFKKILQTELRKRRIVASQFFRDAAAEKMKRDFGITISEDMVVSRALFPMPSMETNISASVINNSHITTVAPGGKVVVHEKKQK